MYAESMFQPDSLVSWRLGVRGSVCQMAQQAGRPAARGAQEEIRAAAGRGGGLLSLQSLLCSAGVLGYVTVILSKEVGQSLRSANHSVFGGVCYEFLRQLLDGNML